mgnify:CR=1 FL=1
MSVKTALVIILLVIGFLMMVIMEIVDNRYEKLQVKQIEMIKSINLTLQTLDSNMIRIYKRLEMKQYNEEKQKWKVPKRENLKK